MKQGWTYDKVPPWMTGLTRDRMLMIDPSLAWYLPADLGSVEFTHDHLMQYGCSYGDSITCFLALRVLVDKQWPYQMYRKATPRNFSAIYEIRDSHSMSCD